jgi:polar amino acid transport system substrate-binding protein
LQYNQIFGKLKLSNVLKGMNMRKIFGIFAIFFISLMFAVSGCGGQTANSLEKIKENGKIRVGVFVDKYPFGYVDSAGKNQGYDVFLAKKIAKDMLGSEENIEFVPMEAMNRAEYLVSNKVDVTLANFTITPERGKVVDFANPYMKVGLGVVSPKSDEITDVSELAGKTVIVNKGTTAEIFFTKNYPDINLLRFDQNTEAASALKAGRGDAFAHDSTMLFAWANENCDYALGIKSLGEGNYIAPAVKKENFELLDWLNAEIERLQNDGFFFEDYDKTLRPVFGDSIDPTQVVITK